MRWIVDTPSNTKYQITYESFGGEFDFYFHPIDDRSALWIVDLTLHYSSVFGKSNKHVEDTHTLNYPRFTFLAKFQVDGRF